MDYNWIFNPPIPSLDFLWNQIEFEEILPTELINEHQFDQIFVASSDAMCGQIWQELIERSDFANRVIVSVSDEKNIALSAVSSSSRQQQYSDEDANYSFDEPSENIIALETNLLPNASPSTFDEPSEIIKATNLLPNASPSTFDEPSEIIKATNLLPNASPSTFDEQQQQRDDNFFRISPPPFAQHSEKQSLSDGINRKNKVGKGRLKRKRLNASCSGQPESPDESAAPLTAAKSSLWHKISKPIMSWFTGSGNDQKGQNSSDNTTEMEFNALHSNWTNIFESMQKEMLRVYNRRMDVKNNAKTATGAEKAVKVPNLEDIFQFIYVDEHANFVGDTFENAAERVYSCKRAFEVKEWSFDELKNECKLPKKVERKSAFSRWIEKAKIFETGQTVFGCMRWTMRQEEQKLNEIFKAFLDGSPLPANICDEEEFREAEGEEIVKGKERDGWESVRAQWLGKATEKSRTRSDSSSSNSSSREEEAAAAPAVGGRKAEKRTIKRKMSPQQKLMRKKIEENKRKAVSDQDQAADHQFDKEEFKKKLEAVLSKNANARPVVDDRKQQSTVRLLPQHRNVEEEQISLESATDRSTNEHQLNDANAMPRSDISMASETDRSNNNKQDNVGTVQMLMNSSEKGGENLRNESMEENGNQKLNKNAVVVDDNMRRREQQELFKIANDHPALWLNEFGELSRYLDKRVAKWECQTLAERGQRVHCRGWEDVHRAIKRFIKFRLVKETNAAENSDTFLTKVAVRPHFFVENNRKNNEIPLKSVMEQAQSVYSGLLKLDEPPTIWNRELVDWVEEWSEFLDNFLNDPPIYRTYRQDVRKNETVIVKVGETEVAEEKLNEAREVLLMVNKTDEILDGMTDEKKVPLLPYHIPRRQEVKSFFNNLNGRKKGELHETSSSIERRTPVKLRKIYMAKESDEENGGKKIESEGETKHNENYTANNGILNFAKSHNADFWLENQKVGGNWECKRSRNNGDRCEEWASIHRAIRRYLAFLEIIEGKTMTDFREQELAKIALFPRLRPENDGNAMTINNKGWIARTWGKFMAKDDGQYMDIKEAMAKVEDAFNLRESDQLKEPMELMNKILLQRVAEWAEFYAQNSQTLNPSVEEAQSILTYVLVKTFEDKNRIMPEIDMKIVKAPPLPKQIATEQNDDQKYDEAAAANSAENKAQNVPTKAQIIQKNKQKKTDEEKEKREEMLQKWKEIEQKLRKQMETYGNEAYTTRLKGAKTNAPNQLVIVHYNFFGFKRHRTVLIPSAAEIVHTVYVVKNGDNSYGMFGSNVFEAWKKAAKCVEIVQNGQIYAGGKECKVEIEAESRAEMFRKWTNLGKALQFKIGALYKENDGFFDDQKLLLQLEQVYGALLNGSALPQLPPNVSENVEQKLYGEMLEKSAQMNERALSRAISYVRQKSILSENPVGDMKRVLSEKAREMLNSIRTGDGVYLEQGKPVNADTIWRLFEQIDRAHDQKAIKNVEKLFPDEEPAEMRAHNMQKWQEIEQILREQMEHYGREHYALRQQNADPNGPNADDVLVLNDSKFFGLYRKKRFILIPNVDEIVHTVYRIEKPDKKTGFATIQHFGPNIFGAWKRAAQCLDAVQTGQHYANANEDCNWTLRSENRRELVYKRWANLGKAVKRGLEAHYKANEGVLDEQKLLQLLEKAFFALVNGTELPALPEKISPVDEANNGLKPLAQDKPADQTPKNAKDQTAQKKSWWDTLKSYLP
uniref:Uncharacterized protein n=1 Tax=Globodera rostochiensis TaxID=31243 RepID=A0A914HZN5_GLORO